MNASRSPSSSLVGALLAAAAFGLTAFVGWALLRRGINLSDEGFLLQQSLDMLGGKILYRDIEMFIAPGIWFVVAGLFAVVEPSVLASRWIAALSYAALAVMIFRLVAVRVGPRIGAACVALYAVLAVWSFPHWTWAWYSPFSILFALLAMQSILRFREERATRHLLYAGLFVGLTAIFKQNYGFFSLAACGLGVVALRLESREPARALARGVFRDALWIGAGLAVAVLPLLVYFGWHGALYSIFDRFVLYPMEFTTGARIPYLPLSALFDHGVFEDRVTSTNYMAQLALSTPVEIPLMPGIASVHALHALLYWVPPALLLVGLALSFWTGDAARRFDFELFVVSATAGLLFLGIFPRADFTHLVTVYQPLLVVGGIVAGRVAARLPERWPLWAWLPVTGTVALAGLLALPATAWLLYLPGTMSSRLPQPRGGVLVHEITAVGINQLVEVVRAHTREGEAFFGIPDMAGINFLAERPVPGSQYQTYAHMIARDRGELTTRQLEAADVRFAIARYDNVLSTEPRLAAYAPILADYLEREFEPTWMIQNDQYLLLERRAEPVPTLPRKSALRDCEFAGGDAPPSSVREHLFFESLFQPLTPGVAEQSAETHCRVRVPQGATLSVQLGYKRPIGVERGATLVGEVAALLDGERRVLLRETVPVRAMRLEGVRVPPPLRADLSDLAGREITLVFRTERRGRVKVSPFTLETYAMFWQDPVLEVPSASAR